MCYFELYPDLAKLKLSHILYLTCQFCAVCFVGKRLVNVDLQLGMWGFYARYKFQVCFVNCQQFQSYPLFDFIHSLCTKMYFSLHQ